MTDVLTTWAVAIFGVKWLLTLKMTTTLVVEPSVTNNSLPKDYPHLDDHAKQRKCRQLALYCRLWSSIGWISWGAQPDICHIFHLSHQGKEFETKLKLKKPGDLSDELRTALGMPIGPSSQLVPPPWLIAMQRYGPPPSYPNLKVPGLNAPIPDVSIGTVAMATAALCVCVKNAFHLKSNLWS